MKNLRIILPAIAIFVLVLLAAYQLFKTKLAPDKLRATPIPTPLTGFPSTEEESPSPTPPGFNQPETGITPQTLPATGGR